MRFICNSAGYQLIAIGSDYEILASGRGRVNKPSFTVKFRQGELTDYERKIAKERLRFSGAPTELDGSEIDPTLTRASSYDTSTIKDPETRKKVEEALLTNGDFNRAYILVEQPRAPKPWPKYDEVKGGRNGTTAQVIAERVSELGMDPADVILYERENQNRSEVIEALEGLGVTVEEDDLVVA